MGLKSQALGPVVRGSVPGVPGGWVPDLVFGSFGSWSLQLRTRNKKWEGSDYPKYWLDMVAHFYLKGHGDSRFVFFWVGVGGFVITRCGPFFCQSLHPPKMARWCCWIPQAQKTSGEAHLSLPSIPEISPWAHFYFGSWRLQVHKIRTSGFFSGGEN